MPINIDYSPVGALVSAAQGAGQAEGQRASFSQGMQLADLNMRQQAADRAFSLQKAYAEREAAQQSRTPAADHVGERADLARKDRDTNQAIYKKQMDDMFASGTIDEAQHQKGMLAVMTGNETLMQHILATPKVQAERDIPAAQEANWRRPFSDRRTIAEGQIRLLHSEIKDAYTPETRKTITDQIDGLKKNIEDTYQAEEDYVTRARGSFRPKSETAAVMPSGQMSITTHPAGGSSNSKANILQMVRQMTADNPGGAKVGDGSTTVTAGGRQPPAEYPDATWDEQRQMWTVIRNNRIMGVQ